MSCWVYSRVETESPGRSEGAEKLLFFSEKVSLKHLTVVLFYYMVRLLHKVHTKQLKGTIKWNGRKLLLT